MLRLRTPIPIPIPRLVTHITSHPRFHIHPSSLPSSISISTSTSTSTSTSQPLSRRRYMSFIKGPNHENTESETSSTSTSTSKSSTSKSPIVTPTSSTSTSTSSTTATSKTASAQIPTSTSTSTSPSTPTPTSTSTSSQPIITPSAITTASTFIPTPSITDPTTTPTPTPTPTVTSPSPASTSSPSSPTKSENPRPIKNRWVELCKGRLSLMSAGTAVGAYTLCGGSLFDVYSCVGLFLGSLSCAVSAATFNQIIERSYDGMMARTKQRPIPSGRISLTTARIFGWTTCALGVGLLAHTTTITTAILGAVTIGIYTHIYTPAKRQTHYNTEIGAIVGALPPLMGWSAAGMSILTGEGLLLSTLLYTWQMHHFMALAWRYRIDYANAGYIMQSHPNLDPDGKKTAGKGLTYAVSMLTLPLLSYAFGITTHMFLITGTLINIPVIYYYYQFYKNPKAPKVVGKALGIGFLQLIAFFLALFFHTQEREHITLFDELRHMRECGVHMCVAMSKDAYRYLCPTAWLPKNETKEEKNTTTTTTPTPTPTSASTATCPIPRITDVKK